jgi:serine/threonine protein phosphatase PrpC
VAEQLGPGSGTLLSDAASAARCAFNERALRFGIERSYRAHGEEITPPGRFCEACGQDLSGPTVVMGTARPAARQGCGSARISDEYCNECGMKAPGARDHVELDLGGLAGVTDLGRRHHRNEDAMALAAIDAPDGPVAFAVVCDGVSTSNRPDEASLAGTQAAARVLAEALGDGRDPAEASTAAISAAADAVTGLMESGHPAEEAPAATYVSAVITGQAVTVCWAGDSRAYWLPADPASPAQQLTKDDSWAQELIAEGMPEAEAQASPQAHQITRWLGVDGGAQAPGLARLEPPGDGVVLICSDGLWNYRPEAADLSALALPTALTDPLGAASRLVAFALEAGGQDNITVVLARFPWPPPAEPAHPVTQPVTIPASHPATVAVPIPAHPTEPAPPAAPGSTPA